MTLTRPVDWATDTNYAAGSEDWSGEPTKLEPSAGRKATGFIPAEIVPADWLNYLVDERGQKIEIVQTHLEGVGSAVGVDITDDDPGGLYAAVRAPALDVALANWSVRSPNFGGQTATAIGAIGGRLVVGCANGAIYTSDDFGTTWTFRTSNTTKRINAFATNGDASVIVAACDDGEIVTSGDADTWTARTSNATGTPDLNAATWDQTNGLFVVVGDIDPTYGVIVTSPTGATWTKRTSLDAVTGANADFLAVASNADGLSALCTTSYFFSSTNGTTWGNGVNPGTTSGNLEIVALPSGRLLAMGQATGIANSAYTDDGITWTAAVAPATSFAPASQVYPGALVVVGPWAYTTRSAIWRTLDGATWTRVGHRGIATGGVAAHALGRVWAANGGADSIDVSLATGVL